MRLECCDNKPVISCKELRTSENPAFLEDPLMSTNEYEINLLHYLSNIAIPNSAVQLWFLIPRTFNSQHSGICKNQERAVGVPGITAMVTNTYLVQCQWQY